MRYVALLLFFGATTSFSSEWIRFESKCFQTDIQKVTQPKAIEICRQRGAVLTSISDQKELDFIRNLLIYPHQYWVWAYRKNHVFQWEGGRYCCPRSWWSTGEPGINESCARLHQGRGEDFRLWGLTCDPQIGFICSKAAWTLVKNTDYYFDVLCGVEIMPNCDGLPCEELCDSHHNCDQFAKMLNICINIKNTTQTDQCVVKLRPNLELYQKNC